MAPPKKIKKGYGLRQREVTIHNPQTDEEVEQFMSAFCRSADEVRAENAAHVRKVLADAETGPDDFYIVTKFGEQAAYVTMAEWLRAHDRLQKIRSRIESGTATPHDLPDLIEWAEKLGTLQERIWWRHGVDPATGTKREKLAVAARESRGALSKGRAARDAQNAERRAEAVARRRSMQAKAEAIWKRHPDWNTSDVARQIIREWPKREAGTPPKFDTLRLQIQKPERA